MKILTIVGARPQIIKSAALSRAVRKWNEEHSGKEVVEDVLHTGQHYDERMSGVFYREMGMREPTFNLGVGGGSHAYQTGEMMKGIEDAVKRGGYDVMVVYGDTNSTLAGALVAAKEHIPLVHIEAGLRSGNMRMPEEVNRIVTDSVSDLLFTPTERGLANLEKDGLTKRSKVWKCGDVMLDNSLYYRETLDKNPRCAEEMGLSEYGDGFVLATVHRAQNTDDDERLKGIMVALEALSKERTVLLPLHPRTRNALARIGMVCETDKEGREWLNGIRVLPPAGYLEMIWLESHAKVVVTDSGGVQKEAYYFGCPSVVLREETEWVENVEAGVSILSGTRKEDVLKATEQMMKLEGAAYPPIYGDGHAAEFILARMVENI